MEVTAPEIVLTVIGEPKPKGRPRVRVGQGVYMDAKTRAAEKAVREAFCTTYPEWKPLEGRLRLEVVFYRRTGRRVDADNLLKLVKDALNTVAWVDDEQVEDERAVRVYGAGDFARTVLKVWSVA